MARGINKVILIGNLGVDPEARFTQAGAPVTNFRIATSEQWRDKQSNETRERTEWHSIVCFGRLAEITAEYLRKGSKVYIEGALRTSSWESDGQTRYKTEIVASELQMLDSRNEGSSGNSNSSNGDWNGGRGNAAERSHNSGAQRPDPVAGTNALNDELDDDIPF